MAGPRRRSRAWGLGACLALGACGGATGNDEAATDRNAVAGQLAAVEVRPGLWEVSSEILAVSQEGLPHAVAERMKGRRRLDRHCISAAQAARPDANFLSAQRNGRCSYSGFEMRGGRIAGAMTCRDPDGTETRARMRGRYRPESYEMRTEMATPGIGPDRIMNVVTRQAGRRVGDCPEEGESNR